MAAPSDDFGFPDEPDLGETGESDMDPPGQPDLAHPDLSGPDLLMLPKVPTFAVPANYAASADPFFLGQGDFNGDNVTDLVTSSFNAHEVSILLGNGDGTFRKAISMQAGTTVWAVGSGDLDGDGDADLALSTTSSIVVMKGDNTGQFAWFGATSLPGARGMAVVDINHDGKLDVASVTSRSVAILLGNGDGSLQAPSVLPDAGNSMYALTVRDLDGNGWEDLAAIDIPQARLCIFLARGNGAFGLPIVLPVGANARQSVVADFNRDGKLDLATANGDSKNNTWDASVILGMGGGKFAPTVFYATAKYPVGLAVADLDLDHIPDLAVATLDGKALSVLRGFGNGTFAPAVDIPAQSQPIGIVAADYDSDGRIDLATVDLQGAGVNVFLNTTR